MPLTNAQKQAAWRGRQRGRVAELENTIRRQAVRIEELEAELARLRNRSADAQLRNRRGGSADGKDGGLGTAEALEGDDRFDGMFAGMFDDIGDTIGQEYVPDAETMARSEARRQDLRARRAAERKKPKFKMWAGHENLSSKKHQSICRKFEHLLTRAVDQSSVPAERDKAEQAARNLMETYSLDPTLKPCYGASADNAVLAKLREEHRAKYRQRVT
jgi:hypothetical protein